MSSHATQLSELVELGIDRHEIHISAAKGREKLTVRVETTITGEQARALADEGITMTPKDVGGQTATQRADRPARRRHRRLPEVRRCRRPQGGVHPDGAASSVDHQARHLRQDRQRPGHRRAQGQLGRDVQARRLQAVGALPRRPARARVDHAGDGRRLMHYFVDGYSTRPQAPQARRRARAVVRPGRQPGRLRLLVRARPAAVAQEPARQQRRRRRRAR